MLKNIKKRNEGFTIIEVLIVLAIAGLILLVVFLAVPALQRNSRNTQRKTDVSSILSAVTEWSNNNQGKFPGATGTERADALNNAKLGFYDKAGTGVVSWASLASGSQTNGTSKDTFMIVTNAKCNGDDATYSSRQLAILYSVETGGGTDDKICQEG